MPSLLIVAHHRADRSPSQRFRFEQYMAWLEQQGWQVTLSPLLSAEDDKMFYARGAWLGKLGVLVRATARRLRDVWRARRADRVLVQREAFMLGTALFERMLRAAVQSNGGQLLFDFDDAIWLPNVSEGNKALGWLKSARKTERIIRVSDHVIAGNAFLADYAKQFNSKVSIIPTTIDTDEYVPGPTHDPAASVVIGWSGSVTTVKHFNLALPALRVLKEHYGERVRFEVVGDGNFVLPELGIVGKPWRKASELDDLRSFDIGIMPLPDEAWAQGKCGLKGLQYMALGIATVMSPVGVNRDIIRHGENGFLASTDVEWVDVLSRLIDNAELRQHLGDAGRQTVVERYSVASQRERYAQVLAGEIVT
jgi:glycosyltransferase involved in cell wall biosynthesis